MRLREVSSCEEAGHVIPVKYEGCDNIVLLESRSKFGQGKSHKPQLVHDSSRIVRQYMGQETHHRAYQVSNTAAG